MGLMPCGGSVLEVTSPQSLAPLAVFLLVFTSACTSTHQPVSGSGFWLYKIQTRQRFPGQKGDKMCQVPQQSKQLFPLHFKQPSWPLAGRLMLIATPATCNQLGSLGRRGRDRLSFHQRSPRFAARAAATHKQQLPGSSHLFHFNIYYSFSDEKEPGRV